jgi:O-antigen ligase
MLLFPALTLTESRGSWVALALGLAVWPFAEPARARFLVAVGLVAPLAAVAVILTERSGALTDPRSMPAELRAAGWRLAVAILVLAALAALASLAVRRLETRLPRRVAWISYVVLPALLLVMTAAAMVSPRRSFDARIDYWRVAWNEFEQNPRLGSGAGTFVRYWERSGIPAGVVDAHSVYLETLAELGPLGLGLLLVALTLPLAAGLRARRRPFAAVALGAYAAFLVHAGLDWDWEMPAVTLAGIVCASALLAAARRGTRAIELGARTRGALLVALGAVAAASVALSSFEG